MTCRIRFVAACFLPVFGMFALTDAPRVRASAADASQWGLSLGKADYVLDAHGSAEAQAGGAVVGAILALVIFNSF